MKKQFGQTIAMGMSITVHSDTNLKYKTLIVKITADGVKFGIRSIINSAIPQSAPTALICCLENEHCIGT